MRYAILGSEGQLGLSIAMHFSRENITFFSFNKNQVDITNKSSIDHLFNDFQFDCLINAAAYTDVEGAENNLELAFEVNGKCLEYLTTKCIERDVLLIHFSTDYVFDGLSKEAYKPASQTNPLNAYGKSKLYGDSVVLGSSVRAIILRISWVFSPFKNNFLTKILDLADSEDRLTIVDDQYGSPTYTFDIARIIPVIVNAYMHSGPSLYNLGGAPQASWLNFADYIIEDAFKKRLIKKKIPLYPIKTEDLSLLARRPALSTLDSRDLCSDFGINEIKWRDGVSEALDYILRKKHD